MSIVNPLLRNLIMVHFQIVLLTAKPKRLRLEPFQRVVSRLVRLIVAKEGGFLSVSSIKQGATGGEKS